MLITKSFSPGTIAVGGTSDVTITLRNQSGADRTLIAFYDQLPAGMRVANPLVVSPGCGTQDQLRDYGNSRGLQPGDTGFHYRRGALAEDATCTVTVRVTVDAPGTYDNHAHTLTHSGGTGPDSNVATLTVPAAPAQPTIAIGFSPDSLDLHDTSTATYTLSNPNGTPLTDASFSHALTGIEVASPAVLGGTCGGVSSAPPLQAGATSLHLTIPNLLAGTCTVTVPVTRRAAAGGTFANQASGVTTAQFGSPGPASNTASITFAKLPLQVMMSASLVSAPPGTPVTYTIGYANPNATLKFQNVVLTDETPRFTTFQSASCGPLPASLYSCAITAPPVGGTGTVTWTLGGTLDAGSSGSVSLTVVIE
jgi:uncharacterized repeat protein (TIGR01451 family)